jgi:hypothetical protein
MKASKFTDAQKVFIIRQGEDDTSVDFCGMVWIRQTPWLK